MTLSSSTMLKLMAYADGELEGAERTEAEEILASDRDAVRFVNQIAGLGEIVARVHEKGAGRAVASFDMTDAIMAAVETAKPDAPVATVTSLATARAKRDDQSRSASETRARNRSSLKIGAGIMTMLALAASIFLFARRGQLSEETPMAKGPPTETEQGTGANTLANAAAGSGVSSGIEVKTAFSPGNSVSVFYLPSANELSTSVVVWIDETGEK